MEGEAVALTKAKTLYKSCINDRKWAQVEPWLVMLQVCPVITKENTIRDMNCCVFTDRKF